MRNLKLVVNNVSNNNDKEIFFIKKELQTILNLYGKMVSNGTWKDYGVSARPRQVSFDIYQRASEKPIYRILKNRVLPFPALSFENKPEQKLEIMTTKDLETQNVRILFFFSGEGERVQNVLITSINILYTWM